MRLAGGCTHDFSLSLNMVIIVMRTLKAIIFVRMDSIYNIMRLYIYIYFNNTFYNSMEIQQNVNILIYKFKIKPAGTELLIFSSILFYLPTPTTLQY